MKKVITIQYNNQEFTSVDCKFILKDSLNQDVLTCDLINENYELRNVAFILGEQPFELTDEEIEELKR